jgi:hypothetical protein
MSRDDDKAQLDKLCKAYEADRVSLSQKQLAEREREIWHVARKFRGHRGTRIIRRLYWFRDRFGENQVNYEYRSSLLVGGSAADVLWTRLDAGTLSLDQAVRTLRDAKKLNSNGTLEELATAVQLVLEQYDKEGFPHAKHPNGRVRTPQVRTPKGEPTPTRTAKLASVPEAQPDPSRSKKSNGHVPARRTRGAAVAPKNTTGRQNLRMPADARRFGMKLRNCAQAELHRLIAGRAERYSIEEYLTDKLNRQFLDWVDTGIADLFRDLTRFQDDAWQEKLTRIGYTRFSQSCEVLSLVIKFGKALTDADADELLKLIRTRQHKRSRDLHSDLKGRAMSDKERAEYDAVQQARSLLEDYVHQMRIPKAHNPRKDSSNATQRRTATTR